MSNVKRYLVVGAHPDDADIVFGGCAVKLSRAGHVVKFVSCCNGDAGHYSLRQPEAPGCGEGLVGTDGSVLRGGAGLAETGAGGGNFFPENEKKADSEPALAQAGGSCFPGPCDVAGCSRDFLAGNNPGDSSAKKNIKAIDGCAVTVCETRRRLALRRKGEALASARVAGLLDYQILDNSDCELLPTLENRREMICLIREFAPDVVVTHRLCDYHADHRATSQLVQDAAYLLSVPLECPDVPLPEKYPVIMLAWDKFQRPYPHEAHVAVAIDDVLREKLLMLNCHESQFYEWLPFNQGRLSEVPESLEGRLGWLTELWLCRNRSQAETTRGLLLERYGEAGRAAGFAETFELSEYGRQPEEGELDELLPR